MPKDVYRHVDRDIFVYLSALSGLQFVHVIDDLRHIYTYIHTYIHTYKHSYKYAYWPLRTWLWNCVLLLWYTNYTIAITNSAEICSLTPIFLMGVSMPASSLVDDLTRVSLLLLNEPVRAYVWSCHHWDCVSCMAHTTGKTFCGVHDRRREYFWRLHKFAANCFHHN